MLEAEAKTDTLLLLSINAVPSTIDGKSSEMGTRLVVGQSVAGQTCCSRLTVMGTLAWAACLVNSAVASWQLHRAIAS